MQSVCVHKAVNSIHAAEGLSQPSVRNDSTLVFRFSERCSPNFQCVDGQTWTFPVLPHSGEDQEGLECYQFSEVAM